MSVVSALRSGAWVGAARLNAVARIMLAVFVAAAVWLSAAVLLGDSHARSALGPDFSPPWAAARSAVSGPPASPYARAALLPLEQGALGPLEPGHVFPYPYPPTYLALTLPLGFLPFHAALLAWTLLGGAAYLAAARRLVP